MRRATAHHDSTLRQEGSIARGGQVANLAGHSVLQDGEEGESGLGAMAELG